MKAARALLVCLCAFINIAYAEGNCPPGMFQTTPVGQAGPIGCAPIPNYNDTPAQPAGPQWATRWGAIVVDTAEPSAGIGVASGMASKRRAEKAALADCKVKGGKRCEVSLAYHNQCAVLIAGINYNKAHGAPTTREAAETGMQQCKRNGIESCQVYWSDCSQSELVQ